MFLEIVRDFLAWFSPVIFGLGVLLLLTADKYNEIEKAANKELGMKRKIVPHVEQNIYSFHEWLVRKIILVGIISIICAFLLFFLFAKRPG